MKLSPSQIPPERKQLYYVGMAVGGFGFLLFLSNFILGPMAFISDAMPGEPGFGESIRGAGKSMVWLTVRGIGGMVLMIAGVMIMNVAARGYAGSGLTLDPEQARKDLEPWNRMAGGMTHDALSEIGLVKKLENRLEEPPGEIPPVHVKVRCRNCQALNDETAKFCSQCGGKM